MALTCHGYLVLEKTGTDGKVEKYFNHCSGLALLRLRLALSKAGFFEQQTH